MLGLGLPELLILAAIGTVPIAGVVVVLFLVLRSRRNDADRD